jgi:membrane protein
MPRGHVPDDVLGPLGWRGRLSLVGRGLGRDDVLGRAGGLAFDTILAIVPMLAIVVAVLDALGAYASIDRSSLRFWLKHTLGVRRSDHLVTLEDGVNQILAIVDSANLASVGLVGLLALLYAIGALFNSIESSLDTVFGTEHARPLRERLINYAALLFALPLLVGAASAPLALLMARLPDDTTIDVVIHVGSALAAILGLTVVFRLAPNLRVRWSSALLGGLVGGLAGYAALQAQVQAQLGVARYNLLYSSLAAFPLLLLWIYFSWVAVLMGAEVAACINDPRSYRWRVEGRHPSHRDRERVALHVAARLAQARLEHGGAVSAEVLTTSAGVPLAVTTGVLAALEAECLVARVDNPRPSYWVTADLERTTAAEVLRAVQLHGSIPSASAEPISGVENLMATIEAAVERSTRELTLAELAGHSKDREEPGS